MLTKLRYDLNEVSILLSVSVKTIDRRIASGEILGAYKDGRKWYIPRESILNYLKNKQSWAH